MLFIGLHMTLFQVIGYDLSRFIGDLGDSRFILAIVEYNFQWMIGNYNNYWEGFFMYPDVEVISYSDNLLGVLPIYAFFRLFGIDYMTSFQLLLISCHVLNYCVCYICFFKLSNNSFASALGAFLFSFSIILNGMHNHPQFTFRFCIPLFFYFFYNYLTSKQVKYLLFTTLALTFQFYLGIYLGYFLLLIAIFFAAFFFIVNWKGFEYLKMTLKHILFFSLVLIISVSPLFYYYFKRSLITGYYVNYEYYMQTIPRFTSYLKSFDSSLIWSVFRNTNVNSLYPWFHTLFPGLFVFVTIGFSFYLSLKRNNIILVLFLVLITFISFTLYYEGHTFYGYLMKVPGIKAARVVSRIVAVLIFIVSWMFCLQLALFHQKFLQTRKWLLIIIPLFLVLDNYCLPAGFKSFSKQESTERVSYVKAKVENQAGNKNLKVLAYLSEKQKDIHLIHIDAMLCALEMNKKTINGYSSSCHRDFGQFWDLADSVSLNHWCEKMKVSMDSVIVVREDAF